jgi:phage baseplate assembly protein W
MAKRGLYRGFSSFEYQKNKTFKVTDIETVKLDLLNHIFTRRGERVMMPRFGTRIPDLAFEPLDDITLLLLEEDLRQVVAFDPRVTLLSLQLEPNYDENSVIARMRLQYVELNLVDSLDINITFEGI